MIERGLVAYWNGDLVDMCNLGTVKYCFFLWFNLGIQMLKLERQLKMHFLMQ
jgi:hypothetical protein